MTNEKNMDPEDNKELNEKEIDMVSGGAGGDPDKGKSSVRSAPANPPSPRHSSTEKGPVT